MTENKGNVLFPIFIRPDKLRFLIVGGGYVGTEKISYMFRHAPDCKVKLVAPEIKDEITELQKQYPSNIQLFKKYFDITDLEDVDVVIIGVADTEISSKIHALVKLKGLIVNVADTPELCDFYLSSVVKKGDLKIAISSNGKSPTLTKRIRELLEEVLPDELDDIIQNLKEIRDNLKGDFEEKVKKLDEITKTLTNIKS